METQWKASILVMEDNPALSRLYAKILTNLGYYVHIALALKDARKLLLSGITFDVFLCDMQMGSHVSTDLLYEMDEFLTARGTQVVIITGNDRSIYASVIADLKIGLVLEKPINFRTFENAITTVLSSSQPLNPRSSIA